MFNLFSYVKDIFYSILNYVNYFRENEIDDIRVFGYDDCIVYTKCDTKEEIMEQVIKDSLDYTKSNDILTQFENLILENGGKILHKKQTELSNVYVLDDKLYKSMKLESSRLTSYKDFQSKISLMKDNGVLMPDKLFTYPDNQVIEMYPYFPESDLFDIIYQKKITCNKIDIISSIIYSMNQLHQLGFAHRDIKLENMLFNSDTKYTYLIDTVMSCKYSDNCPFYGGTTHYASPELLNQIPIIDWRYNDIWGLGIVIYIIMFDLFPWAEADIIKCPIYKKYWENPKYYWNNYPDLDPKIKKLVSGCLVVNPANRLTTLELIDILKDNK